MVGTVEEVGGGGKKVVASRSLFWSLDVAVGEPGGTPRAWSDGMCVITALEAVDRYLLAIQTPPPVMLSSQSIQCCFFAIFKAIEILFHLMQYSSCMGSQS